MTPIYYHPKQQVSHPFISVKKIPEFVRQSGREALGFEPFTVEDLCLAHEPQYVNDVLSLQTANGFNTRDPEINVALHYANASMWTAVRHVLEKGGVACSASQGFHHAHFSNGYGYCTFNGLVIAARKALAYVEHVLIMDGDAHYGDGTEDCLQHLGLAPQITNVTRNQIGAKQHSAFTAAKWQSFTRGLIDQYKPGLVIYQAGADAWDLDPYESGYLSMTGLKHRDEGVFKACKQAGVPVAWNLAGGYSDPMQLTIDIHLQTLAVSDSVIAGLG